MTKGDQVTVTTGICSGRKGTITGFLNKPIDGCTVLVQLEGTPNPIGFRISELAIC